MSDLFMSNLPAGLSVSGAVEERLLSEYGAVFVAKNIAVPDKIVFRDEDDVSNFQNHISTSPASIGGMQMELQSAAMRELLEAIEEAGKYRLSISPRDADSARRSYSETVVLWASRVEPALDHWVSQGKLATKDANQIRALSPFDQVSEILSLEAKGIYFAKDLSKSILYSVAPPGTSQHLSMLAFDIKEHADEDVRGILKRHHWFQTVVSDLPHFTYLGVEEGELSRLGLKKVSNGGRTFWIPDVCFLAN